MSIIEDKLTEMEKNNSLFEKHVRNLPLQPASIFLKNSKIVPCDFKETKITINDNQNNVNVNFPVLTSKGQIVLDSIPNTAKPITPKKVAILFSGGPAGGGHNVILGVKHVLGENNILYGIKGGPKGLIEGNLFEISDQDLDKVKNLGGFDFLGSDRTKIKSPEQFAKVKETVKKFQLDGLIIIGGDDSNTNAAFLAEYLASENCTVVGVPKTIDGDLQIGSLLPISFGFDTATKIYGELVGNILQDTPSSRKYWHFIKLMGRSASHVALEVALKTRPALTYISEEIKEEKINLEDLIKKLVHTILYRAGKGMNYGVVLVPEGLIEFIPDLADLINELNKLFSKYEQELNKIDLGEKIEFMLEKLDKKSVDTFRMLPHEIKRMLLIDRDAHGNLQVSKIPTEVLLIEMAEKYINEIQTDVNKLKEFSGEFTRDEIEKILKFKFSYNNHFFGYEGRCGAPSKFDAVFCYNLGLTAGSLVLKEKTGFMASFTDFSSGGKALAIPLLSLLNEELRLGKKEYVIEKALVKLDSPAFQYFKSRRDEWAKADLFTSPGPRQLWGPVADEMPLTVMLNQAYADFNFLIK